MAWTGAAPIPLGAAALWDVQHRRNPNDETSETPVAQPTRNLSKTVAAAVTNSYLLIFAQQYSVREDSRANRSDRPEPETR